MPNLTPIPPRRQQTIPALDGQWQRRDGGISWRRGRSAGPLWAAALGRQGAGRRRCRHRRGSHAQPVWARKQVFLQRRLTHARERQLPHGDLHNGWNFYSPFCLTPLQTHPKRDYFLCMNKLCAGWSKPKIITNTVGPPCVYVEVFYT